MTGRPPDQLTGVPLLPTSTTVAPPPVKLKAKAKTAPPRTVAKSAATSTARPLAGGLAVPLTAGGLLALDPVQFDTIAGDATARAQVDALLRSMTRRAVVIAALAGLLAAALPFFQPIIRYYAISPERQVTMMVPLDLPNLTNRAILSWSANAVTEIMTIGFGDFDAKLGAQRNRFTANGWDAFRTAFLANKIDQALRQHQLVLTTVPADTPVIVSQGENDEHAYQWKVQMPVTMTYATNNNRSVPSAAVVELTITRVPYERSATGIAIDSWKQTRR